MRNTFSEANRDRPASKDDLALAKKAAKGDPVSQEAVARLAHPLIERQTKKFCMRFCADNHFHQRCTLETSWGLQHEDAPYCDWGNHSYAWMLEDLTGPKRLMAFSGKEGAKFSTYLYTIVHSLPFYERWKDFRFGRRIRVPEYIKKIAPLASKIFLWLLDQHSNALMAQKAKVAEETIREVADQIIAELTHREKLYLLDAPKTVSLTGQGSDDDDPESENAMGDIRDDSWDPIKDQIRKQIADGFKQLTPVEQFVLEAMVIEGRNANDVLKALVQSEVSIKEGVMPRKINRQQLYDFKNKTLGKLMRITKLNK